MNTRRTSKQPPELRVHALRADAREGIIARGTHRPSLCELMRAPRAAEVFTHGADTAPGLADNWSGSYLVRHTPELSSDGPAGGWMDPLGRRSRLT